MGAYSDRQLDRKELSVAEGKTDHGFASELMDGVEGFVAFGDRLGERGVEFASCYLFRGCLGVAELAMGEAALCGAGRGTESATKNGAVLVKIASAGGGVEHGAELVIAKFFECICVLVIFGEDARGGIAGEAGHKPSDGSGDTGAEAGGSDRIGRGENLEPSAEALGILMRDGEDALTALSASGSADEVRAAPERGGGESGFDDLDEVGHGVPT